MYGKLWYKHSHTHLPQEQKEHIPSATHAYRRAGERESGGEGERREGGRGSIMYVYRVLKSVELRTYNIWFVVIFRYNRL